MSVISLNCRNSSCSRYVAWPEWAKPIGLPISRFLTLRLDASVEDGASSDIFIVHLFWHADCISWGCYLRSWQVCLPTCLCNSFFSNLQHGYTRSSVIAVFYDSFCLGDTSFCLQLNLLKHVLFSTLTSQVATGLSSAIIPARCSVYCENCETPEQSFLPIWIINTRR